MGNFLVKDKNSSFLTDVFYFSAQQQLPEYLKARKGIRWLWASSRESIRLYLKKEKLKGKQNFPAWVIVPLKTIRVATLQSFLEWASTETGLHFILIGEEIDHKVSAMNFSKNRIIVLPERNASSILEFVKFKGNGKSVVPTDFVSEKRKYMRKAYHTPAIVKKLNSTQVKNKIQFIVDSDIKDYSIGGVKIHLKNHSLSISDEVNLIYQDKRGQWVSSHTQVRWVASNKAGGCFVGLQFIALSA